MTKICRALFYSYLCLPWILHGQSSIKNVLILYADDQRFNTIRALGNPEIHTPNLDRLVHRGVTFTRAFTQGGLHGALCVPSRAMLMTGRYLLGLQKAGDVIPLEHLMLPERLRQLHYTTFGIGKWHNDVASYARSFSDGAAIFFGGMHFPEKGGQEKPLKVDFDPHGLYKIPPTNAETYSSELYADEAIKFLDSQRHHSPPFLCYVAFTSPHDPRTPPPPIKNLYTTGHISLPPNYLPQHPFDNGELHVRDELLLARPMTEEMVKNELALYYGMVTELDHQIGRILDVVDKHGLTASTLIIFAGDNGLAVGSHGLLGKQSVYDHSMHIPLILAHPGLPPGLKLDQLVYIADIAPSIYDLLGQSIPPGVQGQSFVPYIQQPALKGRSHVFHVYRNLQRAVRTVDDWKYIRYDVAGQVTEQLFNLKQDPWETKNLVLQKKYRRKLAWLRTILSESQTALGAEL